MYLLLNQTRDKIAMILYLFQRNCHNLHTRQDFVEQHYFAAEYYVCEVSTVVAVCFLIRPSASFYLLFFQNYEVPYSSRLKRLTVLHTPPPSQKNKVIHPFLHSMELEICSSR